MNNQSNQWDSTITKSVHSLGEISKLMPALTSKPEVPAEPVQEIKVDGRRKRNPTLEAAVAYSFKHLDVSVADIAKQFGVSLQGLYDKRHREKLKMKAKSKPKAAKTANATPAWKQASVSTSAAPVKQDVVNHPAHYKTGGIETIDFIEAKQLTYNLGNVVKYITRAGVKNKATHIEDLEKAAWYLNREINNLKGGA